MGCGPGVPCGRREPGDRGARPLRALGHLAANMVDKAGYDQSKIPLRDIIFNSSSSNTGAPLMLQQLAWAFRTQPERTTSALETIDYVLAQRNLTFVVAGPLVSKETFERDIIQHISTLPAGSTALVAGSQMAEIIWNRFRREWWEANTTAFYTIDSLILFDGPGAKLDRLQVEHLCHAGAS